MSKLFFHSKAHENDHHQLRSYFHSPDMFLKFKPQKLCNGCCAPDRNFPVRFRMLIVWAQSPRHQRATVKKSAISQAMNGLRKYVVTF